MTEHAVVEVSPEQICFVAVMKLPLAIPSVISQPLRELFICTKSTSKSSPHFWSDSLGLPDYSCSGTQYQCITISLAPEHKHAFGTDRHVGRRHFICHESNISDVELKRAQRMLSFGLRPDPTVLQDRNAVSWSCVCLM
ncbi:hypothetical protein QTP86_014368 [Hemibagrus guttatus]|nr:hypothetical protein QTP86_014368 [Hemibagrus guttatus]